jgi:DNA-binding transcriptional LysR family regulator
MEIRHLKTFCAVAKLLSFNRAANELHYAQSSVSAQIQALEDDLDVRLFDRLGRRILLTDAGERLLEYAGKILDLADETRAEIANVKEPRGSLIIRIPETFGVHRLPPVIKEFRTRFPKIGLKFITCAQEGLEEDLRKGVTDLAFLLAESIQAADLAVEPLGYEYLVMVAHPDHPLAQKTVVKTGDLENETNLLSKVDCSYRKIYQEILDRENVRPGETLEFNSVEAIKKCVMEGIGITILPEVTVARDITRGRLAMLAWEEGKIEVAQLMVSYKNRWLSPTLGAFMEMTRKFLG